MIKYIWLFYGIVLSVLVNAQEVRHRFIFVGDAGEINEGQQTLIHAAAELILPHHTTACFLGDNIYPTGMGLAREERILGERSLRSQYEPFRSRDVPVYFLAGNHDWDVSGEQGLQKLMAQDSFLCAQNDSLLRLVPHAGDLGPFVLPISDSLSLIMYDSENWVFPHHQDLMEFEEQKKAFLDSLSSVVTAKSKQQLLILSHHPMHSFGEHSLKFTAKQHLFPLTRLNKRLYIPLPILGSLYPLWRSKWFNSAEDLPHPIYKNLIDKVTEITRKHKNVLFLAGHDHGMQYIEEQHIRQIVSGSGSKTSFVQKGKDLLFRSENQGFCIVDCLEDESLSVQFYIYKDHEATLVYKKQLAKEY